MKQEPTTRTAMLPVSALFFLLYWALRCGYPAYLRILTADLSGIFLTTTLDAAMLAVPLCLVLRRRRAAGIAFAAVGLLLAAGNTDQILNFAKFFLLRSAAVNLQLFRTCALPSILLLLAADACFQEGRTAIVLLNAVTVCVTAVLAWMIYDSFGSILAWLLVLLKNYAVIMVYQDVTFHSSLLPEALRYVFLLLGFLFLGLSSLPRAATDDEDDEEEEQTAPSPQPACESDSGAPAPEPIALPPAADRSTQILQKYQELLELGAITQEEFEEKKDQLFL